jgi:PAS domain S-box-containing protein
MVFESTESKRLKEGALPLAGLLAGIVLWITGAILIVGFLIPHNTTWVSFLWISILLFSPLIFVFLYILLKTYGGESVPSNNHLQVMDEQYKMVSEAIDDVLWDWDLTANTICYSKNYKTLFGCEPVEEEPLSSFLKHVHADDQERVANSIRDALAMPGIAKWKLEYRCLRADESIVEVLNRAVIYRNAEDKSFRIVGVILDLTDRIKTVEEIKKLSLIASKTENAAIITDKHRQIEWANEAFEKLTGYTAHDVTGKNLDDFLKGTETDPYTVERISKRLERAESVSEEILYYTKSGEKFWVNLKISPVMNSEGKVERYISIQSDITRQKEYELNITAIARELSSLIENANAVIFGVDRHGYINEWNQVCAQLTGFAKNEILSKKFVQVMLDSNAQSVGDSILEKVLQGSPISNYELPLLCRNKSKTIILLNATPRFNAKREVIGALIVGQDITELTAYRKTLEQKVKERTKELSDSLEKEKELAELKSRFVAIASHEFRTPLSSIQFAAGFIKKYKSRLTTEDIDQKLDNIENQVRHMTVLLEDVLTIGKSEAGKIQASYEKIDMKEFSSKIIEEVLLSTGQSHTIQFEYHATIKEIYSDEKLLRNILINLLSNAIKFSPKKKIVHFICSDAEAGLHIEVRDYGIGIDQVDKAKIFEPFHRGSNSTTINGTGLGLSIVKKATELLQGSIEFESHVNKGTIFQITLPIAHGQNNALA